MARISKADRLQAEQFIRESLKSKIDKLAGNPGIVKARQKAMKAHDKHIGYTQIKEQIEAHREEIAELVELLEKSIKEYSWNPSGWSWDYDKEYQRQLEEVGKAAEADTLDGKEIAELEGQLRDVSKAVFLATTHEDLAELVRELS
jgi:hypothetical protein